MRLFLIAAALATFGFAKQPDPLIWGGMKPGPHAIGFRSYFELDETRRFDRPRGPRPILVHIWYPAGAPPTEPLRYREYVTLPPLPRYPLFGPELEKFLLDTVSEGLFRKKNSALNREERDFFDALLAKSTLAYRDAPPSPGRFPVLLYHSGAAGSFEENSVMCEYLASHGYVVMTSAFPSLDGQHVSNNYGEPETSWSDLTYLLAHARTLAFADPLKAGAFGHSMGAQYLLEWIGQRHAPLRAVVSLDSTLEYTPQGYPGHRSLRKRFARLGPTRVPVLIAASADRRPNFATWNRYLPRRAEVAVRYFNHSDFLLHGSLARAFGRDQEVEVRRNYDRLAQAVCAFFDAQLRGSSANWKQLVTENSDDFRVTERRIDSATPAR